LVVVVTEADVVESNPIREIRPTRSDPIRLKTQNDPTLDDSIFDLIRFETRNDPTLDDPIRDPTRLDTIRLTRQPVPKTH
jgi:ribosomal protein S10